MKLVSIPLTVVVEYDQDVAKHLKPEAVPGLADSFLNLGFHDAFARVDPAIPLPKIVVHGPGCICCDPDETAMFGEER